MWWGGPYEAIAVEGRRVRKREAGEGARGQQHKTERDGSVSGAPRETAMEGDGARWCGVVWIRWWWWWGRAFANAKRDRGQRAKKPKPSRSGSVSGCIWAAGGRGGAVTSQHPLPQ
jgi:hypothetical protein